MFDERCLWSRAECVNRRASEILETIEEPFFLYLHYMDPHDPYQPPETHRTIAGSTPPEPLVAFSDQTKYRSADDGRYHLILDGLEKRLTLFDLRADPLEQRDLYAGGHPEVPRLARALDDWLDRTGQRARFDLALTASMAQKEQLRALGYLE